jgi:hypothetical protein
MQHGQDARQEIRSGKGLLHPMGSSDLVTGESCTNLIPEEARARASVRRMRSWLAALLAPLFTWTAAQQCEAAALPIVRLP